MSHASLPAVRPLALAAVFLLALLAGACPAAAGTVSWNVDADGNWADGTNWDAGTPPGSGDDVVIDRAAGLYTITVSSPAQAASVLCGEQLLISGGSLTIAGGLTLGGAVYLGDASGYGYLTLQGAQSLGGTGEVIMGPSANNTLAGSGGILTIGPGIWIHGHSGRLQTSLGFVNQGRISADTDGGTITLTGSGWSNAGIVEATGGGALNLGGTFTTAGLGDFRGAGGRIAITGVMDNTADTLALDATRGSLYVAANGRFKGGTVQPGSGGAELVPENLAQLEAVTFEADLSVGVVASATTYVYNGLTVNGTVHVGGGTTYGQLSFSGTQSLLGTGEVVLGASGSNAVLGSGGVLTVGSGVWIHGRNGRVQDGLGFVNEGRISADTAGGTILLDGTGWSNAGIVEATGGGALNLGGTFTTAGLGDFRGAGGRIAITGTMDNTADTLTLDATTGSLYVAMNARFKGGTVQPGSGGSELVLENLAKLEAVTYEADLQVGVTASAMVYVYNGLTLNAAAYVGGETTYGQLSFSGTQSLLGTGEVVLGASGSNAILGSGGVLTIGSAVWIHGRNGRVQDGLGFVNEGRISADTAGGTILLDGTGWSNAGIVEATGGGALNLGGTFTTAGLGDFRGAGGRIAIIGVMDNTGDSLAPDATTGSLHVAMNGRFKGGTVQPGSGGSELVLENLAKLEAVTYEADLQVGVTASASVYVYNGLTVNGTAHVGGETTYGQLNVSGDQVLGGTGELLFGPSPSNLIYGTIGTLTTGPELWIHGENGEIRHGANLQTQGRISADVAGGTIELDAPAWSNTGTVEAFGGGRLLSQSPATNAGTVRAGRDGLVACEDPYTQTAGATVVDSSGVFSSPLPILIQGGEIRGRGTIEGQLVSAGVVAPGGSPGTLTCDGDYEQDAGGTLWLELGGTAGALHDRLAVTGAAALAGTLAVDLVLDYIPAYGDSFLVLQHASCTGDFDPVVLPDPPAGLAWRLSHRPLELVLSVGGSSQSALISAVADVPDDQGGWLTVSWWASAQDDPEAPQPVTEYEVQRFEGAWTALDTVPATGALSYAAEVATDDVLVVGGPEPWSYYRVLARTADPGVFYNSPQDSGYSLDNLPPPAPVLRLTEDPDLRLLHWSNPDVPDFAHTCLYRGEQPGFQEDSLLVCTADTSWVEGHPFFYWYFARAVDVHGNQSPNSEEMQYVYPTAAPPAAAAGPSLDPVRPNPFNPSATIAFHLPRPARARLRVHDLAGRLVRTLLPGAVLPAGAHEVAWDGRDEAGRRVGSGVYLCRLEAEGRSRSRRLVLLK